MVNCISDCQKTRIGLWHQNQRCAQLRRLPARRLCHRRPHGMAPVAGECTERTDRVDVNMNVIYWFMVALCNRADHIYFCPVVTSFFFSSPNLSHRRLDVCHTSTHGVALVRISDAGLKPAARGSLKTQDAKKSPKIAICAPSHNFVGLYLRN